MLEGVKVRAKDEDEDEEEEEAFDPEAVEKKISEMQAKMKEAIKHFEQQMSQLRTGRADPRMLEGVKVKSKDAEVNLFHCAQVTVSEARTLSVTVFDPELVKSVDKAIRESGLNLNPMIAGNVLKVPIPKTTSEARAQLAKTAAGQAEGAKVSVRRVRAGAMEKVKKLGLPKDDAKRVEKEVQAHTDRYTKQIDTLLEAKQKELTSA
uniref:Ribosome recycling factor domain-containing protein n=1 Tax=Hemiselmis andersenii TaxID=464988 RepID=A0A7S1EFQ7_HEMAN|mmetsp:Transcript_46702/g.113604  ORF Transcript_46702/g.113604 Transcript_46702/m.113604 type:complete len:207 (+) Transcript_46702:2-622(+)